MSLTLTCCLLSEYGFLNWTVTSSIYACVNFENNKLYYLLTNVLKSLEGETGCLRTVECLKVSDDLERSQRVKGKSFFINDNTMEDFRLFQNMP